MDNRLLIVFRASAEWGYGHLYRDVRLAKKVKSYFEVTLTSNVNEIIKDMMEESGLSWLPLNDDEIISYIKKNQVKLVLVDRLNNTKEFIASLKSLNCKVVLLDDQGDGAYLADVLINALVELPSKVPTRYYSGADYVVYNDDMELYARLPKKDENENKKVLVSFGGSDPQNISALILPIIKENPYHDFVLVLGPGNKKQSEIMDAVKNINNVNVLCNLSSLTQLIYEADLCIVSGGVTLYECMYLGKKTFVACQVQHQIDSVVRYQDVANIFGLGLINQNSSKKLSLISEYLNGSFSPFNKKQREFKNGLLQIEAILKELLE